MISSKGLRVVDPGDKVAGVMETRIVSASVSPKDWAADPARLGAWLSCGTKPRTHKYPKSSPTKPSDAPICFSLQLPRILAQQHLQPWREFARSAHAKWISMMSHTGINDSGTRGLQPNSTPARRKRRTTQTHGLGPDARSCPHCGRTFKRTEHLDRHVRTRQ